MTPRQTAILVGAIVTFFAACIALVSCCPLRDDLTGRKPEAKATATVAYCALPEPAGQENPDEPLIAARSKIIGNLSKPTRAKVILTGTSKAAEVTLPAGTYVEEP